jgi:hypothetical protein
MSEQRSFWQRLFGRTGTSSLSTREVLREDYVRRNCSQAEVEQIVSSPEFIESARERLGESFRSEEFRL